MSDFQFVLGTAGHIDHGKTTLIKALTGIDCDRLDEEKERGITIVLGFASITLPSGRSGGVVDVPGHERLVRTMIAGATGIDVALLVVAADEGMMPQTREHLAILDLLGVRRGVVAVNKADLVDEELLELACEEVAEDLIGTVLEGAPVVPCSAVSGVGLDDLRAELDRAVEGVATRSGQGPFRLPVDRVFTLKGFGTVVTGTCVSGTVEKGEDVEILPDGRRCRVRGIEVHGTSQDRAAPSRRTALNLQGVSTDEVHRGDQVVSPGRVCSSSMVNVSLRYLESAPVAHPAGGQVRFLTGTAEAIAVLDPVDQPGPDDAVPPGWSGTVQLRLDRPVAVARGDKVIVRRISPIVTTGGGVVVDPLPRRFKRRRRDRELQLLDALADPDAPLEAHLRALLDDAEPLPLAQADLARRMSVPADDVHAALVALEGAGAVLRLDDGTAVSAGVLQRHGQAIVDEVDAYHRRYPLRPGVPRNQLRTSLRGAVERPLFDRLLAHTAAEADLEDERGRIRRAGFEPQPTAAQREVLDAIEAEYRDAELAPPNVADIRRRIGAPDDFDDLMGYLRDREQLIRVTEDILVHRDVWADLVGRVRGALAGGGEMTPTVFKELTGLSRKHAIPYLETLDRQKVTVRVGNVRRLREE